VGLWLSNRPIPFIGPTERSQSEDSRADTAEGLVCLGRHVPCENDDGLSALAKTFQGADDISARDDVGIRKGKDGDMRTIADAAIGEARITCGYRLVDIGPHDASPYHRAHFLSPTV